jgi:hypothetical protein
MNLRDAVIRTSASNQSLLMRGRIAALKNEQSIGTMAAVDEIFASLTVTEAPAISPSHKHLFRFVSNVSAFDDADVR